MLEFTILDFVLVSALCYLFGVGTGCCWVTEHKETFLQRARSFEDIQRYNHQNQMPPPDAIIASAPPLVATDSLGIPLDNQKHIIINQ
jgi:hypothetical protein